MLQIGAGWREKLTRFFPSRLLNSGTRKWKLETRKDGTRDSGLGIWGLGLVEAPRTEDEANRSQWS